MNYNVTKSNTLSASEKLEISQSETILPEVPVEIIYPNELNSYLRDQLRYYVHKNGMLEKNLNELEERYSACKQNVSKLEVKLSDYENLCDKSKINTSSQIIGSKIVELSKKLREKTSEVEIMKTKYSKLEKQAHELKNHLESETFTKQGAPPNTPLNSVSDDEIKKYTDKVSHLTNKVTDAKNMNIQLKKELQLAKKLLQQEIGESFDNLQAIYNANSSGWRGRAQIICDLQQKNSELKDKLKHVQGSINLVETAQAPNKVEAQLTVLTKENAELKNKSEDIKKKHDAAKARVKVLDMEYTMAKSKLSMLKDQAGRDQEIIATLSKQINSTKESKNDLLSQKEHAVTKLQLEKKQLFQEMEEYKSVIQTLREELKTLNDTKKVDKDKKQTPRGQGEVIKDNIIGTESKEHSEMFELIENLNKRLKLERDAHAKTQGTLRAEKQKSTKAEATIARMELETNSSLKSGYSSTSSLRPLEPSLKDRLELAEESLKALQTRLEMEQMERKADLHTFAQILKSYGIQVSPQNNEINSQ